MTCFSNCRKSVQNKERPDHRSRFDNIEKTTLFFPYSYGILFEVLIRASSSTWSVGVPVQCEGRPHVISAR